MSSPNRLRLIGSRPSTKAVAILLSLAAVTGCGEYGKPKIVAGVPAQVDYKKEQPEYDPSNPPLWPQHYYFGLEQCSNDIAAAESGHEIDHPHFDPDIHSYGTNCFVDQIEVPLNVYSQYNEGEIIVFEGSVGEPIGRVTN